MPYTPLFTTPALSAVITRTIDAVGIRHAYWLVEPNVVLTLAGVKGFTYAPWKPPLPLRALEEALATLGILLAQKDGVLAVYSHPGLERIARRSTFRFVVPPRTSPPMIATIHASLEEGIEEAIARGELSEDDGDDVFQGVLLGYPEVVVRAYIDHLRRDTKSHADLVEVNVLSAHPLAEEIPCAIPNFDVPQEIVEHPDVVACAEASRALLASFYDEPIARRVVDDPAYAMCKRQEADTRDDVLRRRAAERARA